MRGQSIKFSFLVLAVFSSLSAKAELGEKARLEIAKGALEQTQKLFEAASDVDRKCSVQVAKRIAGSAARFFKLELPLLTRANGTPFSDECNQASHEFKFRASAIYKSNKWLLAKVLTAFDSTVEFDQEAACADLKPGQSRYPLFRSYRVTRMKDYYLAQFNLKFIASPGLDKSYEQSMRKRVNECLREASFLQDHAGNKLKLALVKPGSAQAKKLFQHNIGLGENVRSNSGHYDVNLDCAGITHELLHLAGLNDEYAEEPYSCRPHGESIMATHYLYVASPKGMAALPDFIPSKGLPGTSALEYAFLFGSADSEFLPVNEIVCKHDGTSDQKVLRASEGKMQFAERTGFGARTYYETRSERVDEWAGYIPRQEADPELPLASKPHLRQLMKVDPGQAWTCEVKVAEDASPVPRAKLLGKAFYPLRPAHFRKIVFPSCTAKNEKYNRCTKEAYIVPQSGYQCATRKYADCQGERFLD